jgi:hypothetical protein
VTDHDRDVDAQLEKLRKATEEVAPRPDFGRRVAQAIAKESRGGVLYGLARPARRLLPALALAAAVSIVWAVDSDSVFDDALTSYPDEALELEW